MLLDVSEGFMKFYAGLEGFYLGLTGFVCYEPVIFGFIVLAGGTAH